MILVMGLSKTGKSICEYLSKNKREFMVYDASYEAILPYKTMGIKSYSADEVIDEPVDLVIKSPGIPPHEEHVKFFNQKDIEIISDIEFFYREYMPKDLIAITGTNGKTTTTKMAFELLKEKGAVMGGNVGIPIMELIPGKNDIFIFELSSFGLDGTKSFRPHVAILLNIDEDHIDWHESFENYKNAKYKIFKNQLPNDYLIIDADSIDLREIKTDAHILQFSTEKINGMNSYLEGDDIVFAIDDDILTVNMSKLRYKEKHNIINFMASVLAAMIYGIDYEDIERFNREFSLDAHRIERFLNYNGVEYVDDSKATNPHAVVAALDNFHNNTILILGGFDKETNFDRLLIKASKLKKIVFCGDIKDKLKSRADELDINNYQLCDKLIDAAKYVVSIAEAGDTVLFSPGASSFDEFNGYKERGEKFQNYIKEALDA